MMIDLAGYAGSTPALGTKEREGPAGELWSSLRGFSSQCCILTGLFSG